MRVETFKPSLAAWNRFGPAARRLELDEWRSRAFSEQEMRQQFTSQDAIICLAHEDDALYGFACAGPADRSRSTATLFNILISRDMRHTGLLARLMGVMERQLVRRGYRNLVIDARVATGFADAVQRHYGRHAVVAQPDHASPWGLQRTIRVHLVPSDAISPGNARLRKTAS